MESDAHKGTTRAIVSIGAGHGNHVMKWIWGNAFWALGGCTCAHCSAKRKYNIYKNVRFRISTQSFALLSSHSTLYVFKNVLRRGKRRWHTLFTFHFKCISEGNVRKVSGAYCGFFFLSFMVYSGAEVMSGTGLVFFHCRCVTPSPFPLPPPPCIKSHMIWGASAVRACWLHWSLKRTWTRTDRN